MHKNKKKLSQKFAVYQKARTFAPLFKTTTNNRGIAQLASVLAWGASGRAFESHYSDKPLRKSTAFFVPIFKKYRATHLFIGLQHGSVGNILG